MAYILVVDDEPDIGAIVHEMLADDGYRVVVATSAAQALAICTQEMPQLLICDYWMTPTSGAALCAHLAQDSRAARLRIILMTASSEGLVPHDCPHDAFLKKPFDMDTLLSQVASLLSPVGSSDTC